MKLRIARHTNQLNEITTFYCNILGLEKLGHFENHDGYDGVFISLSSENWELEFTSTDEVVNHTFGEEDLIVLYLEQHQLSDIRVSLAKSGIKELVPKNPYWRRMGIYFKDPDGHGVMLALNDKTPIA